MARMETYLEIGDRYFQTKDYVEAVKWYRKAAEQGNATAQYNLGDCYYYGDGVQQSYTEAVKWFRKAAEQGDAIAQYSLGLCYYDGDGVPQSYTEAVMWLRKAAEQGDDEAQNNLGLCYVGGHGVHKDNAEAARLFFAAAQQGNEKAQCNLGKCYYDGDGVPQSYTEAVKWYRRAAEQGDGTAQINLAGCYLQGHGVENNSAEAARWYLAAAQQGIESAQCNLGNCYYEGNGVPQSYTEAVKWYRKAAEQGNALAQYYLGQCYYDGDGVPQSYTEAAKWFRKAAEQGDEEAQYYLGSCYQHGYGVDKDLQAATKWYSESAAKGNELAQNALLEMKHIGDAAAFGAKKKTDDPVSQLKTEDCTLEQLLDELEGMTGLAGVKQQVRTQVAQIKVEQMAREKGLTVAKPDASRHMVFTGNPGTGKTTVARLIGRIYGALGVLPKGDVFVECSRRDLVAEYIGQTDKRVQKKVQEAMGGILFIDEAYSLYRDDSPSDFGQEAIDALIQCMENNRDELIVILAGYTREMHHMLKHANPGLKSRVRTEIRFEDYSPEELFSIYESMMKKQGKTLTPEAGDEARAVLTLRVKDPDFGNARGARNLMETVLEKQQLRLAGMKDFSEKDYRTVLPEDVRAAVNVGRIAGKKSLQELLAQLDRMVGLTNAKEEVHKRVAAIQVAEMAKKAGAAHNMGEISPHMVFTGNPGTGKTTVARLIGQIYGSLGVLPKGEVLVECSRADLVGTHVGETAPMVREKVQEAMSGILFIDEAYSLYKGDSGNDFGQEAIDTLIQCMENNRGSLVVILAGYTKEMHQMLQFANPGLKSRIGTEIQFEDYTAPECCQIFCSMLAENGLQLQEDVSDALLTELFTLCVAASDFGNARGVRNIVDKVIDARNTRLFERSVSGEALHKEDFETICAQDVKTILKIIKTQPGANVCHIGK